MSAEKKKDRYRESLQLPKTAFSMRAGLLTKEPRFQERWEAIDLYRRQQDQPHPAGPFVFHDGPPYANGNIHMGHLINKILKDLVVRSRQMAGHEVQFVPGWDCHGLPIEHKVMKELGKEAAELGTMEIRQRCHDYAASFQKIQAEQMIRLGTSGDYENPYMTMLPAYEGAVLEVFAALVGNGIVYRDLKPVHWSIENRTALAEAELEYHDRRDTSVFVFFEVDDPAVLPQSLAAPAGDRVDLMIWTTTPWTLPANLAVAAGPVAEYGLYRIHHGDAVRLTVVAVDLAEKVLGEEAELLGRCRGAELSEAGVRYRHPFIERVSPVVVADYVTLEDGTGLVHTAPGHGQEDYETGLRMGLEIYCPVLEDGTFDETAPEWLQGLDVWSANPVVVSTLEGSGHLFKQHTILHSYPHDWRSKTPTIFRATEQWFVGVDRPFGDEEFEPSPACVGGGGRPHQLRTRVGPEAVHRDARDSARLVHLAATLMGPAHSRVPFRTRSSADRNDGSCGGALCSRQWFRRLVLRGTADDPRRLRSGDRRGGARVVAAGRSGWSRRSRQG